MSARESEKQKEKIQNTMGTSDRDSAVSPRQPVQIGSKNSGNTSKLNSYSRGRRIKRELIKREKVGGGAKKRS